MNIALMGCGTVGSGVYELIQKNNIFFSNKYGTELNIKHILVRDLEKRKNHKSYELFTTDFEEIDKDKDIDIVIEVIGGISPAREYILRSLNNKRHVITANKELIAKHGLELMKTAEQNGVALLYEASVAGAIPIIDSIKSGLSGNIVTEITGIVNGTTNFILTSMKEKGLSFNTALELAQELGYAESCPDSDIHGLDSARKLVILSMIAFNKNIEMEQMKIEGITNITLQDIKYADKLGYEIKLLINSKNNIKGINAIVAPFLVNKNHQLATIKDVFNAVTVKCDAAEDITLIGKGAGKFPTASAVLGNVMQIISHNVHTRNNDVKKANIISNQEHSYYIRFELNNQQINKQTKEYIENLKNIDYEKDEKNIVLITDKLNLKELEGIVATFYNLNNIECKNKIMIY